MNKKKFDNLSPKMKNLMMSKWIKGYMKRGLSLEDAQFAARWKSGTWKLSDRMRVVLANMEKL
tara:strand:- start:343 stop:531 length:189 start_codon:yes stop_codon:yes gene_type:complete